MNVIRAAGTDGFEKPRFAFSFFVADALDLAVDLFGRGHAAAG